MDTYILNWLSVYGERLITVCLWVGGILVIGLFVYVCFIFNPSAAHKEE